MKTRILLCIIAIAVLGGSMQSCRYRPRRTGSHRTESRMSSRSDNSRVRRSESRSIDNGNSERVPIRRESGVMFIPVEINGIPMDFIFDTGASAVSMSLTEALFLYKQGKLTDDDILGSEQFQDATGGISVGTVINLRSVVIGNREVTNVRASVVENQGAPLLLGQTVLENFGKVTIDYNNNYITFE